MAKNWYLNLTAYWITLNIGFVKKYLSLKIGGGAIQY